MKKYRKLLSIISALTLALTLSACGTAKSTDTSKAQTTQETASYASGITYDQIMKSPEDYQGKNVKFTGSVVDISNKDNSTMIKIAVGDKPEEVITACCKGNADAEKVTSKNIITVSGTFTGTVNYKAVTGEQISMPGIWIDKIEINK